MTSTYRKTKCETNAAKFIKKFHLNALYPGALCGIIFSAIDDEKN